MLTGSASNYAESRHKSTVRSVQSDVQVGPQWRQITVTTVAVSTRNILYKHLQPEPEWDAWSKTRRTLRRPSRSGFRPFATRSTGPGASESPLRVCYVSVTCSLQILLRKGEPEFSIEIPAVGCHGYSSRPKCFSREKGQREQSWPRKP